MKPIGHALSQAADVGDGGFGIETFPRVNFEHPELCLEISRSTLYIDVVELMVMVANPHLIYMYFLNIFSSSDACWPCSGPSCGCWRGGSQC